MFSSAYETQAENKKHNNQNKAKNPPVDYGALLDGQSSIPYNPSAPVQMFVRDEDEKAKMPVQAKSTQRNEGEERKPKANSTADSTSMPDNLQSKMENSFGTSFADVKVHRDDMSATNMGALAYTQGNDVHFAPGQFNPDTKQGHQLLGHELTHVVQQRQGRVKPDEKQNKGGFKVNTDTSLENEADLMGKKAAEGKSVGVLGKGSGVQMQSVPDPEYGYYTITEDDPNLYRVGIKLGIPWIELARINGLDLVKPIIRPGMVIKYPVSRVENTPEYQTTEDADEQQLINEYKRQIIIYLQSICELKQQYAETWYENTRAEDTNWGQIILETTLSLALGALTAGIGGMIGKLVASKLTGYIQEGVKSAVKDLVDNLLQMGANAIGSSASSGLANSAQAGLAHTFKNASWAQFQTEKVSLSTGANFSTENVDALRVASNAFKQTNDDLVADGSGVLQQLTMGYLNFQDNVYVSHAAGVNENDNPVAAESKISDYQSDIDKKDVTETGARMGRLHFKGEISGDIASASVVIDEGIYDEMNEGTANYLQGLRFSELLAHGVTMSFDLKAWDSDRHFWTDDIFGRGKVAFETGPRGTFVDSRNYDSDTTLYDTGSEWLSHHYLGRSLELSDPHAYSEMGANKLFGSSIKNLTVPPLNGEWF